MERGKLELTALMERNEKIGKSRKLLEETLKELDRLHPIDIAAKPKQ